MARPKNAFNEQWGNVALDGGDAAPASQTAAANNEGKPPLVDAYGRPWVNVLGSGPGGESKVIPVPGATGAAVDSLQHAQIIGDPPAALIAAGPGKFYLASAINPVSLDRWLQVFDLAAAGPPVNGDIPIFQIELTHASAEMSQEINFLNMGVLFNDNLKVAVSTSVNVLTVGGASPYWIHVLYWNQ
jgi:hypothetical protein